MHRAIGPCQEHFSSSLSSHHFHALLNRRCRALYLCNATTSLVWPCKLTTCVEVLPRPPGHHLVAVSVGVCRMNCCASTSYVAVVCRPRTKVPWPSSVWA